MVYNPLSEKGLAVLNQEAAFLFSQINGKRTLGDILNLAEKEDPKVSFADIQRVLNDFLSSEIIYLDKPIFKTRLFAKKPKHLGVWLHITNQCNLRCTYCYVYKTPDKMNVGTAQKAVEKIFQAAKKHGFEKITFKFSGGEALLELRTVLEVVNQARALGKEYGLEVDFVVLTNGVLLTEEVAKTLKENKLRAMISLDGLGEYHDRTRVFADGRGSFKEVEKGIEYLQKFKVPFNVSITITSKNIENIPELTKYLLGRKIPFAFNFYRENPHVKEELEGDDQKLVECLKKAYKLIAKDPPRYSLLNGLLDRVTFKRPHLYTCGMGKSYLVISHDGKLASCQMTLEKPIGSIEDEDLIETMKEGDFIQPKGLTVEGKTSCKDCQWKYICCGGCPLLTFEQRERYDVSSPYCAVYKALIPEALRVEASRLIKYGAKAAKPQAQDIKSPFVL